MSNGWFVPGVPLAIDPGATVAPEPKPYPPIGGVTKNWSAIELPTDHCDANGFPKKRKRKRSKR
jgi:hypothetical protein